MGLNKDLVRYAHKMQDARQEVLVDIGAFSNLVDLLVSRDVKRLYFISGKQTKKLKLYDSFIDSLNQAGIRSFIYSEVDKFPDSRTVERCAAQCQTYNCDAIVALGGGTVIDVAKLVSVWVTNANKSLYQLRGIGKIPNPGVELYVVATTGSGAEASACSLIRDDQQISLFYSEHMVPKTVILDPNLILRLPTENLVSAALVAFTHAVEAYVSSFSMEFPADRANVLVAVPIFFSYLEKCYKHGVKNDVMYLQVMMAPYYSGVATRRIGFGLAHSLALRIAYKYDLPLGKVCAALLPVVLEAELDYIAEPLSELALCAHLCSAKATKEDAALAFIEGVRSLMRRVNVSETVTSLKADDYNEIIEMVLLDLKTWGCPMKVSYKTLIGILRAIK